ncbi:glycosyltransferase [Marinilabilia salmonicolor]|uniref:glycosyltransferase n=1 Tax=Marinilabilia salmonicolor TaxID=989 RepID=UPI00029A73CB|nr:glycosyltransferase [Marinilabilia salmonicolor]
MNILFICSSKVWGGNEKWVSNAMSGLKKRHNVFFIGKDNHLRGRFDSDIPFYSASFGSVLDLSSLRKIEQVVTDNQIEVIVSTKKKEYVLGGLAARRQGVRHFLRLGIVRKMKWPLWHRWVYGRLNDGIIVNAHRIKQELMRYSWMREHPVRVIYNGMPGLKEMTVSSASTVSFMVLSTGMLTRRKGFHLLIDALAQLPEEIKSVLQVHLLGKGREEESLKTQIRKLGLQKIVSMEGFTSPDPWLKRASLFCLFSANEGISNALTEAMAAGVPVLTTDAGGAAEFIVNGQNGFLVERDVESIAAKLKELIAMHPKELRACGQKGKETVSSLFDTDRMVAELEMCLHNFA